MVIVMNPNVTQEQVERVVHFVHQRGARTHVSYGEQRVIIGVIGHKSEIQKEQLKTLDGVENVFSILKPYKLVSRDFKPEDTVIPLNGVRIGNGEPVVIAGPCSVESEAQIIEAAWIVKEHGGHLLRGGAFKPRTSPYSFQGLGEQGLKYLRRAREETGLYIVTEVLDANDLPLVAEYADVLQIGARNMQNFNLLKAVGRLNKPVLLKRGMSATLTEFLMSAEYIMSEGNEQIILCERGIRTFVEYTRNTLDLAVVPAVRQISHLPIIVDPSHGTGRSDLIEPMALAAMAAGAQGLMVEMHPRPEEALSDADQSLSPVQFARLMRKVNQFVQWQKRDETFENSLV
ncbi:MAG: 3-deoxy-7-phosphoheptulonate synthase [Calditrichaeota bacterium]|nr:MAG: 3-deoxy-7-phosphoheptulonate synthase [Calditrichota bacterium]